MAFRMAERRAVRKVEMTARRMARGERVTGVGRGMDEIEYRLVALRLMIVCTSTPQSRSSLGQPIGVQAWCVKKEAAMT